jgi:hypothetical protein
MKTNAIRILTIRDIETEWAERRAHASTDAVTEREMNAVQ